MAKRYEDDEVPIVKKHACIVCKRSGRSGTKSLVSEGWLEVKGGLVCPACPEPEA